MIIVLEGLDGCGKSSAAHALHTHLVSLGHEALYYREPGGTENGEQIRDFLLRHREQPLNYLTEMLLFFASRREGIVNLVNKNPDAIIVMDRFVHSTFAYQVMAGGADEHLYQMLVTGVTRGMRPVSMEFFLNADKATRDSRRVSRGEPTDSIESRGKDYYRNVERGFEVARKQSRWPVRVIDANRTLQETVSQMMHHLYAKYPELKK